MTSFLEMMAAPFVVALILVAMHGYLGSHVVKRGVIFVDIALAQVAAFGVAVALFLGGEIGTDQAFLAGLGSTLLGAVLLSRSRTRDDRIPQEAYIGIVYVVFSAAMILILTQVPHGGEEIRHLLVGAILWVTWPTVVKTAVIYGVLGVILFFAHPTLHLISVDPEDAQRQGISLARWDFLFYLILGTVVTSSVQIAGVLLVFTLLVVPTVMAIRLFSTQRSQALFALGTGTLAVSGGTLASWVLDLPTGAAIVCTFGLILAIQILLEHLLRARH